MRILSIHSDGIVRGGAEVVYIYGSKLLRSRGHTTALLHIGDTAEIIDSDTLVYRLEEFRYKKNWRKNFSLAAGFLYSPRAYQLAKRALKEFKPDIVHLHILQGHLSPAVLLPFHEQNIPIVQTVHDYRQLCPATHFLSHDQVCEACKGKKYYQAIVKRCRKGSLLRSTVAAIGSYTSDYLYRYDHLISSYIAPGEFLRQKMIAFGYSPAKTHTIYNAYFGDIVEQQEIQREHILFAGRLSAEKGVDLLVHAAKDLDIPVNIAGDGPERENLQALADQLGADNVHFLGHLPPDKLRQQYRTALLTVLPSRWYENGPLVLLESFANATPVVGARIGAIPEFIEEGETGDLFRPNDSADLSRVLQAHIGEREALRQMGITALVRVKENFSPAVYIKNLEERLERAIHGNP